MTDWNKMTEKQKKHKREYNTDFMRRVKLCVLIHYSGTNPSQCANLYNEHKESYTNIFTLSLDHIDGNGAKQLREAGLSGHKLYLWLMRNNYPEGYQVLCMNCQWIKRIKNKEVGRKGRSKAQVLNS